ncbi:ATPase AAA [Sorangium cellulosum]|uniref:ATPase AAA n=1 Tax=Sorangium cellulosum TaxID=56 RepID=A0A4P2PVV8_SORCE|nr:sigma 54-interacting transcriptional regulator [Sorangium cellulosum]AUX20800.1 ATPase AAA [Sorangium cellulosum]
MLGHDVLPTLITRLMTATHFEGAATAALEAMLDCVHAALAESPFATSARLLRAMVHLRPSDGYQRLFGVEHRTGAQVEGTGYLTSANVWRWVSEHRCSVSIDVQRGVLHAWVPEGRVERREPIDAAGVPGHETRERMLGRDATHVHVVPLRTPGEGVSGMIAIEASCKAAAGQEFVWGDCEEQLELIATAAVAYLGALPPRPSCAARTDALLPVVGRATAGLIELLRVFAQQEETVLISGPTGSGKSRLARWCHEQSRREGKRFETLDLLSVPEELQMAELFGWKRGAFTGAMRDAAGAIARAAQGTLFIDEIDKLSLKAQAGLLRVLEERRYRPLGDEGSDKHADVRFIVGTNADLRAQVRAGKLREDLYYRINVLPVRLPPLSERLDELPLWAEYMLGRRHEEAGGGGAVRIAREAVDLLMSTPWPGNLRQLDNMVRRAYAIALSDRGGAGSELLLARRHVERALAYDGAPEPGTLFEQLLRTARAFVQEAEQREGSASPLSLDLIDAQRGLVLAVAVQRRGRDAAFALLGQEQLLRNRNHHRALKRELDRVRELLHVIGGEVDPALASLLDSADATAEGR